MPKPPAYVDIECNGLDENQRSHVKETVSDSEFYLRDHVRVAEKRHMFHLKPFEDNKSNEVSVAQFKEEMSSRFPETNVSLNRKQSHANHYGEVTYQIKIGSGSDEQELNESGADITTIQPDYDSDTDSPEQN